MNFYEVIKNRRSIRHYKPDAVKKETLEKILNSARLAPSWKNSQNWQFIILSEDNSKESILEAFDDKNPGKKTLTKAPLVIVLCSKPEDSGQLDGKNYYMVDGAIAMEHLVLAAKAEGLGTCWLGLFNENIVKKALEIPSDWRVIAITPLGYPDQDPSPRPRKELNEIISWEKWSK